MKTITLTDTEHEVLIQLLKMASNEFSNHGCNDFELPNTDEAWEIIKKYELYNSGNLDDLINRPNKKTICYYDWILFCYFRAKLEGKIK